MKDTKKEPTKGAKIFAGIFTAVIIIGLFTLGTKGMNTDNKDITDYKHPISGTSEPDTKVKDTTPAVPAEYKSALKSAQNYEKIMNMSKRGLYDQLISEYGDKFTPEAAQYAIDNISADWNANALASAKNYQSSMSMSPAAIRDQLISEYGDKFTEAEADYAVANLNS